MTFFISKKIRSRNHECPAVSIEPGWHHLAIGHRGLFHDKDLASECCLLQSEDFVDRRICISFIYFRKPEKLKRSSISYFLIDQTDLSMLDLWFLTWYTMLRSRYQFDKSLHYSCWHAGMHWPNQRIFSLRMWIHEKISYNCRLVEHSEFMPL